MYNGPLKSVKIFYSYSHRDEALRKELETHLSLLKRQGYITDWHDRKIEAGTEWSREISKHLNTSQIILLLVSPDFIASDYCYDIEVKQALERHDSGESCVIPILLRHVEWNDALFGKLQPLPSNKKPVMDWYGLNGRDKAFQNIVKGIRRVVEEYSGKAETMDKREEFQNQYKVLFDEIIYLLKNENFEQFLEKFSILESEMIQPIEKMKMHQSIAQHLQTFAFSCFNNWRYERGVKAFRLAMEIDHQHADEYLSNMGCCYLELENLDDANQAFSEALKLNPSNWVALLGKSQVLSKETLLEAFNLLEYATLIVPTEPLLWNQRGILSLRLGEYEKALAAFQQALNLSRDNVNILRNMALTLKKLNRFSEAEDVEYCILTIEGER